MPKNTATRRIKQRLHTNANRGQNNTQLNKPSGRDL